MQTGQKWSSTRKWLLMLHNITLTSDLPTTRDHVTSHVISDLFRFYCSLGVIWNMHAYRLEYDLAGPLCSNRSSLLVYSYLWSLPRTFSY